MDDVAAANRAMNKAAQDAIDMSGLLLADKVESMKRVAELEGALETIHAWLVCSPIATDADMAQSFGEMERVAREALQR